MTKLKNLTHSPFSISTKTGVAFLPAYGEIEGEFEESYLNMLRIGGMVEVFEDREYPAPKRGRPKKAKD